jgi:catechol 2,3-dioxygenase-like lactoylglutathione lyase family enzyme
MMQKEEKIATNRSPAVFGRGDTGVRHVGLYARDPAATAEFYRDVMGMQIVGGSSADHPFGASAFLTSCPEEEAQELALFANRTFATLPSGWLHSRSYDLFITESLIEKSK